MITNLIFDLSGYGGSANFTAATTTDLINELNTLTGVAWYWDPADCKPKSNFYPGVPPVITTAYKVSFVDIDGDSTGFCNAGSLDYTKFTEIDLSGYGGSATTPITNATDIINAFAALTPSLIASVSGCSIIINNWDRNNTPTNVEVNKIAGCVINTQSYGGLSVSSLSLYEESTSGLNPFEIQYTVTMFGNVGTPPITTDFGDGSTPVVNNFPYPLILHTFPALNGLYTVTSSCTDDNGNLSTATNQIYVTGGDVIFSDSSTNASPASFRLNTLQTPITFDTTDCNNILWSLNMPLGFKVTQPTVGTQEVEMIFGGVTTPITTSAGASGMANFVNIPGTFNIPGSNPLIINYKTNGIITASFDVTVVIT